MTGFDSKRSAAQDKLTDDADTLTIVYQQGFADGKRAAQPKQEPVAMRMPKVGDKVICLEDESLGKVVSLTAGGSPDITFDDGSRGTYLLSEFAELFGYVAPSAAEPPAEWELIKNILAEYGLDAIAFVAEWKAAQRPWQGLTDEDLKLLSAEWRIVYGAWMDDFAKDIEAKLKERNGY